MINYKCKCYMKGGHYNPAWKFSLMPPHFHSNDLHFILTSENTMLALEFLYFTRFTPLALVGIGHTKVKWLNAIQAQKISSCPPATCPTCHHWSGGLDPKHERLRLTIKIQLPLETWVFTILRFTLYTLQFDPLTYTFWLKWKVRGKFVFSGLQSTVWLHLLKSLQSAI